MNLVDLSKSIFQKKKKEDWEEILNHYTTSVFNILNVKSLKLAFKDSNNTTLYLPYMWDNAIMPMLSKVAESYVIDAYKEALFKDGEVPELTPEDISLIITNYLADYLAILINCVSSYELSLHQDQRLLFREYMQVHGFKKCLNSYKLANSTVH